MNNVNNCTVDGDPFNAGKIKINRREEHVWSRNLYHRLKSQTVAAFPTRKGPLFPFAALLSLHRDSLARLPISDERADSVASALFPAGPYARGVILFLRSMTLSEKEK